MRREAAPRPLRSPFEEWASTFDPEMRSARYWWPTLAISSATTLAFVAFLSLVPGVREFFRLQPAVPLLLVGARVGLYFALAGFERVRGGSTLFFAVATHAMGFTFQLLASSLVAFSEAPGAFLLATLPVLGAGYFCTVVRATPRFPWPALAPALAMPVALALRPEPTQLAIFAVAGPLAVTVGFLLGMLGATLARSRETLASHRRAIEVHSMEERTGEARRLSSSLLEILQQSHDASSAISAALLGADHLATLVRRGDPRERPLVERAVASLRSSLERIGHIQGMPGDDAATDSEAPQATAAVAPCMRTAIAQAAHQFPAQRIDPPRLSSGARTAQVALDGGAEGLEQLMTELLKNACEGNGTVRAKRVTVSVDAESDPERVTIRIADDGPGFPSHILSAAPTAFVTTKRGGSGLGLYTADRLLTANGGSLELSNPAAGGALVVIRLRRHASGPGIAGG